MGLKAWLKVGLSPYNPSEILGELQLKEVIPLPPDSRLSSNRSAFSENNSRKFKVIAREAVAENDSAKVKKLENTALLPHTKLAIVQAENNDLRLAVRTEKRLASVVEESLKI